MKKTKVLQNKKGECVLSLIGDSMEDVMLLCIKDEEGIVNFEMNHLDVAYLVDSLLKHNDLTYKDVKKTLKECNLLMN